MPTLYITRSFAATEFACRDADRTPYPAFWIPDRLFPLCVELEKLRAALGGHPITVLSGYRTSAHNRAIGGAENSQHLVGRAADIQVRGVLAEAVHDMALRMHARGELLIGGLGAYPFFTHLDVREGSRLARWVGTRTAV